MDIAILTVSNIIPGENGHNILYAAPKQFVKYKALLIPENATTIVNGSGKMKVNKKKNAANKTVGLHRLCQFMIRKYYRKTG